MKVEAKFDTSGLDAQLSKLSPGQMRAAYKRALSRGTKRMRKLAVDTAKRRTNVKLGEIRKTIVARKVAGSGRNAGHGDLLIRNRRIPMIMFKGVGSKKGRRGTRRRAATEGGITVKIDPKGKRLLLKGTFRATLGGREQILSRKLQGNRRVWRTPTKTIYGPRIVQNFGDRRRVERILEAGGVTYRDTLRSEVERRLKA